MPYTLESHSLPSSLGLAGYIDIPAMVPGLAEANITKFISSSLSAFWSWLWVTTFVDQKVQDH